MHHKFFLFARKLVYFIHIKEPRDGTKISKSVPVPANLRIEFTKIFNLNLFTDSSKAHDPKGFEKGKKFRKGKPEAETRER